MQIACKNGDTDMLKTLLANSKAGVDSKAVLNYDGLSPLMHAIVNGHMEIAKLLLQYGANIDAVNTKGEFALKLAVREGNTQMIQFLLNRGAQTAVKYERGAPILMEAIQNIGKGKLSDGEILSHVCLLLNGDANPNVPTEQRETHL